MKKMIKYDSNYTNFFIYQIINNLASWIWRITLMCYFVYNLHTNIFQQTLFTGSMLIPSIIFSIKIGSITQNISIKHGYISINLCKLILIIMILIIQNIWFVLLITTLMTIAHIFSNTLDQVTIKNLSTNNPELLDKYNKGYIIVFQIITCIMPPLVSIYIQMIEYKYLFIISAIIFIFSLIPIYKLIPVNKQTIEINNTTNMINSFRAFYSKLIKHNNALLILILSLCFINLLSFTSDSYENILIRDKYKLPELYIGIVTSITSIGMLIGTLVISKFNKYEEYIVKIVPFLYLIIMFLHVINKNSFILMLIFLIDGCLYGSCQISQQTVIQKYSNNNIGIFYGALVTIEQLIAYSFTFILGLLFNNKNINYIYLTMFIATLFFILYIYYIKSSTSKI